MVEESESSCVIGGKFEGKKILCIFQFSPGPRLLQVSQVSPRRHHHRQLRQAFVSTGVEAEGAGNEYDGGVNILLF